MPSLTEPSFSLHLKVTALALSHLVKCSFIIPSSLEVAIYSICVPVFSWVIPFAFKLYSRDTKQAFCFILLEEARAEATHQPVRVMIEKWRIMNRKKVKAKTSQLITKTLSLPKAFQIQDCWITSSNKVQRQAPKPLLSFGLWTFHLVWNQHVSVFLNLSVSLQALTLQIKD